jgi:hypothetical protein
MRDVLLWVVAFVATWVVLLVVVATLLRWRFERRNRVSPAVKSPAPVTWLWSPRRTARLHRRLQGAVADIHLAPSRRSPHRGPASVDELRRELEYQAVELDHHLVIVARHPRRRRSSLVRSLEEQVTEIEELSVRLSRLAGRPEGTPASGWDITRQPPDVLAVIARQLDVLDEAQEELTAIERAAGLVDTDHTGVVIDVTDATDVDDLLVRGEAQERTAGPTGSELSPPNDPPRPPATH